MELNVYHYVFSFIRDHVVYSNEMERFDKYS